MMDVAKIEKAVLLKARLLIEGVKVEANIESLLPYRSRTEHLYRHDNGAHGFTPRYPQEIVLLDGVDPSCTVVCNIRYNQASSIVLYAENGTAILNVSGEKISVSLAPLPSYYGLKQGSVSPSSVVQMMGMDLIGSVPFNSCSYFSSKTECIFCEIVSSYQKSREYPAARKKTQDIADCIALAINNDRCVRNVVITAGNFPVQNDMHDLFCEILHEVKRKASFSDIYIFGSLMSPEDFSFIDKMRAAGFSGVGYNLEGWHPELFDHIAPGKSLYGRDKMLDALSYASEIYGIGHAYSNLVFGIQSLGTSLDASGYDSNREVDLCMEAVEGLLERSVIPLFTLYHTTGSNPIGPIKLSLDAVVDFHTKYAKRVYASKLLNKDRSGVLFNVSSISNHVYNDFLLLERARATVS